MVKLKSINKRILFAVFILTAIVAKSQVIVPFDKAKNSVLDFYLPKLKLSIEIKVEKQEFEEPDFDEKKIKNFIPIKDKRNHKDLYYIKEIKLNKVWLPDKNRHYAVEKPGKNSFAFTPFGVIEGINLKGTKNMELPELVSNIYKPVEETVSYNNLFIKKNFKTVYDTSYKVIRKDSVVIKRPVVYELKKTKSEKDKIYDLVHYLVKTRKRKFRLISGLDTINYNPEIFKLKLKNLDSLESLLYRSLVGFYDYKEYDFSVDLDLSKEKDTIINLNPYRGFTSINGIPVIVEIKKVFESVTNNEKDEKGIPYINAAFAEVIVSYGSEVIYKEIVPVPQFGSVNYIKSNVEYLKLTPWGSIGGVGLSN